MKAKEKAKELVQKFYSKYNNVAKNKSYSNEQKRMALICVDEIIDQTPRFVPEETFIGDSCGVDYFINEKFDYWQEVKNELEKL